MFRTVACVLLVAAAAFAVPITKEKEMTKMESKTNDEPWTTTTWWSSTWTSTWIPSTTEMIMEKEEEKKMMHDDVMTTSTIIPLPTDMPKDEPTKVGAKMAMMNELPPSTTMLMADWHSTTEHSHEHDDSSDSDEDKERKGKKVADEPKWSTTWTPEWSTTWTPEITTIKLMDKVKA